MAQQIALDSEAIAAAAKSDNTTRELAPDIAYKRLAIVNVVFVGPPGAPDRSWVLVDTGVIGWHQLH